MAYERIRTRSHTNCIYIDIRERTHGDNESSCVCAEDGPHPLTHKYLRGGRCAETTLRELGEMGSQRNAVDAHRTFVT